MLYEAVFRGATRRQVVKINLLLMLQLAAVAGARTAHLSSRRHIALD
jgi:hypothetical protein